MSETYLSTKDRIEQVISEDFQERNYEADISVTKSSLGWIQLKVVSSKFEGLPDEEREVIIDQALAKIDMHLGMYPFAGYDLLAPDESPTHLSTPLVQLPLWSEILLAPEAQSSNGFTVEEKVPLIVTFYSFKGGVGRTTALAVTASLLAESDRRVVMIDFELEAPGLSVMLQPVEEEGARCGVLDYVYQRWLTPDENIPSIADCIRRVGRSGSELFLVPAGDYDENYIHRLADFDVEKLYRQDPNPIHKLIGDVANYLNPDVILIDARTGFDEVGAVALFDLADLAMVCFTPNEQSYRGLEWVLRAAYKQKQSQGKPDLRFVLTPMPPIPDKVDEWLVTVDDWITALWDLDIDTAPEEIRTQIEYDINIPAVENIVDGLSDSVRINYQPIADFIDAALPNLEKGIFVGDLRTQILEELQFEPVTADQIKAEDIPNIFQRTGDFPRFLSNRTNLIRGAKGTGKSLLFRLFVEKPNRARELAKPYADLEKVEFIGAHGRPTLDPFILDRSDFMSFEAQVGAQHWESLWRAYTLLRLHHKMLDIPIQDQELKHVLDDLTDVGSVSHQKIVAWLVDIAHSAERGPAINDALRNIDKWLKKETKQAWLLYDELDTGFGLETESYDRRQRAVEALLSWWLEASDTFSQIKMKCFIREDIWRKLSFPNKSHYTGRDMLLRWQEEDLWRLVLRQALNSPTFADYMDKSFGLNAVNLEIRDLEQLRRILHPLWGERMGGVNKAYTHRWVLKRIADGQENRFPRSLVFLLSRAVERERGLGSWEQGTVLRPRSLINSMPHVSEKRVEEVREEYPEFDSALDKLRGQRSPLIRETLDELWNDLNINISNLIDNLIQAGILEKRRPAKGENSPRYAIAELYLSGLGMLRKGPG